MTDLLALGALELRDRMAAGAVEATALAQACIARVAEREPAIQAWSWFDADHVLRQATALDRRRQAGEPVGPLHGLPVAVKDVFDTAGIPTENGTMLDAGRVPAQDSWVVARLKQAGALILGKTVTAELAFLAPGKTRNPHRPDHTPGGSSSGSAAAVAAGMAPLAVGTQTGGSVIRPAAFCGIVGFKPSFGRIPRTGILTQSPSLDTVGIFARSVEDVALLAECLFGEGADDSGTALALRPPLLAAALAAPPAPPALAFVRQPAWEAADAETKSGLSDLAAALGEACEPQDLPAAFDRALETRALINHAEMALAFRRYEERGRERLRPQTLAGMEDGKRITAPDYLCALEIQRSLSAALDEVFAGYDALMTPAAPGPAPRGLESTGSSVFNGIWTLCGTPAITVPLLKAGNGLPIGVQLVGRHGDDARLLRTAQWLVRRFSTG